MFLTERIVGIGIYAFFLMLTCVLIVRKNSNVSIILKIYAVVLSLMGFFYVPYVTADLYRIYNILEFFSTLSFSEFYETRFLLKSDRISLLFYWLISQTGFFQLLPAITAYVCYSCIFYTVTQTAKRYMIEKKYVAMTVFFLMSTSTYMFVISGIRCMLAICLISFCFFRETTEKKQSLFHLVLYALAALMHNFAVIIVGLRLVLPLFDKTKKSRLKILYVFFLLFAAFFLLIFEPDLLREVLEKAETYLEGNMYTYIWEYIVAFLVVFLCVLLLYYHSKLSQEDRDDLNQNKLFMLICVLLALCFCFEFTIFHRFTTYLLPILSIPMLMKVFSQMRKKKDAVCYNGFFVGTLIVFLISCVRGTLCSLKFFVL